MIIFRKSFAISCVMIFHFAVSTFDLTAIRRSFEWLMKIEVFSISISISFSKFFSITIFASIIVLNRSLWCVNNVETIAFIELKTMRLEFTDHLWARSVQQIRYSELWICDHVKLLYKDRYVNMQRLIVEKISLTSKLLKYSNKAFESLISLQVERKTS